MIRSSVIRVGACVTAFVLVTGAAPAAAVNAIDDRQERFKVLLPDNWRVWTHRDALELAREKAFNLRGMTGKDIAQFALFVTPPEPSQRYAETFYVLAVDDSEYLDESMLREVEQEMKQRLRGLGFTYIPELAELVPVDGVNWLKLRGAVDLPQINDQAVALMYVVPGEKRTFALLFFASTLTYDQFEPFFESIAASFRPADPLPPPSPFYGKWPFFLIFGGVLGAGAGFLVYQIRNS